LIIVCILCYNSTDSQQGFASDYDNLYATGGGILVWRQKPFTGLFDWHVEANFDAHCANRINLPGRQSMIFTRACLPTIERLV
jgi:hypothetical protein